MVELLSPHFYGYLIKIILSILLGGLIGIERELTHHSAGFRTHILVSLGATLFMFITIFDRLSLPAGVNINLDATRVAAGVVTGIGFLGAGVIFKEGANVKGLTTAATIWVTAAVGLLVGIGNYIMAVISTLLILIVLFSDNMLENKFFKSTELMYLEISFKNIKGEKHDIERMIRKKATKFHLSSFVKVDKKITLKYRLTLRKENREPLTKILLKDNNIISVKWSE